MQLNLFNSNQTDYSWQNFIILDENKHVYHSVISNLSWKCLILFWPKSSGKTHLAHIWQLMNDTIFINVNNFISEIRYSNAFVLEDIQNVQDEVMLTHCYNYMKENNKRLLITSSTSPNKLNFELKDLSSRILSTTSIKIPSASEELLRIMLMKRFSDKQLKIDLKVIDYILARVERSFYSISEIIEKVDDESMGSNVTLPFISALLKKDTT
ncbi:chorismate synthase [Wolbachia endosymbiont of Mansonella ozzardi]|uniref:DnaA ATPase domain-containing protein n=1 Tax=Wolbachia endosymbiont of Mansonella ozzardi TaxID=137464 RepID=UPI0034CDAF3B|nr:chorismate synthase [Wolbachia endosymbiont of Mansonella ozzardi]